MIPDLDVHTVNRNGRAIVFVTGEIDAAVADRFREALRAAQNESTDVIVDFTDVTFVDSSAPNALIGAYKAAAEPSRLRVVGVRPSIRRVFDITRITDLLLDDTFQPSEIGELIWQQVTFHRSGWRQWVTENQSDDGVPVAQIVEVGPWAGFGSDRAHYLLETSGRATLYGSLADAMRAAEDPASAVALPGPQGPPNRHEKPTTTPS